MERLVSPPDGPPAPPPERGSGARTAALQALLAFGGLVALVLLVVRLGDGLHPLVLAGVGAILLWPLRKETAARTVLLALGVVVTVYVVRTLAGVLAPFIGVFVLAYLLNPIVRWAEAKNVPRWVTTAGLTLAALGGIVAIALLLVPAFVGQFERLAASALTVVADLPHHR